MDTGARNLVSTLGLDTLGDVHTDSSGPRLSYAQTIQNLVEQGVLCRGDLRGLLRKPATVGGGENYDTGEGSSG
ncbi:hypothetical protein ASG92_22575 [Arthrobacter sp. Soil736]|uniref:hypothetical protein n=1 Tax=Arthrobacter sp. Soil736 TaxID=1736395 RepID=UPI0006F82467|nr:hypothetical protein [Arthrobacter sp. Soil736]KRE59415.1 hypothetical protein ASG92_22575 [Arthrobacter sp. Soil736]